MLPGGLRRRRVRSVTRDPHAPCDVDARPSGGPPQDRDLLRTRAEQVAPEESRTQSERLREALRFSVAAPGGRGAAMRDGFAVLDTAAAHVVHARR